MDVFVSRWFTAHIGLLPVLNGAAAFPTDLPRCNCIRVKQCETFTRLLLNHRPHESYAVFQIVRDAGCGYSGLDPLVCCPPAVAEMFGIERAGNSDSSRSSGIWAWPQQEQTRERDSSLHSAFDTFNRFGKEADESFEKRSYHESDIFDFKHPKTHRNFPQSFYEEIDPANSHFDGHLQQSDSSKFHKNAFLHQLPHAHSVTHPGESSEEDSTDFDHYERPVVYPDDQRLNRPIIFPTSAGQKPSTNARKVAVVTTTTARPAVSSARCGIPISGASNTSERHYPWLARIAYLNKTNNRITYRCSGSVINQFHILTAAHCVVNLINDLMLSHIRVDSTEQSADCRSNANDCKTATTFQISETIVHPNYDQPQFANDIAILRIVESSSGDQGYTPICLPPNLSTADMNKLIGSTGIALGWSTDVGGSDIVNPKVKFLNLPIVNTTECAITYAKYSENFNDPIVITPSQLCAQGRPMNDVCRGDSGGPFMDDGTSGLIDTSGRHTLLGIVAFGPTKCGESNIPGVYTRVSSYAEWIAANIR